MDLLWRPARHTSIARSPCLQPGRLPLAFVVQCCRLCPPPCQIWKPLRENLQGAEPGIGWDSLRLHLCCPKAGSCASLQQGGEGCHPANWEGEGLGLPQSLRSYICTQTWPQPESYCLTRINILTPCLLNSLIQENEKKTNTNHQHSYSSLKQDMQISRRAEDLLLPTTPKWSLWMRTLTCYLLSGTVHLS